MTMTECPECGEETSLYECGDCGLAHCVDCRLPENHTCDSPDPTETEAGGPLEFIGFNMKQWAAVVILWAFSVAGNPTINSAAGMVGAFIGMWVVVAAASSVWAKLRSSNGSKPTTEEATSES